MSMQINGILDRLEATTASGWVNVTGDIKSDGVKPLITISVGGEIVAEGFATQSRPDIEKLGGLAFGFLLKLNSGINNLKTPSNLSVVASYKNTKATLKIYKPIELSLQFLSLTADQQLNFIGRITNSGHMPVFHSANMLAAAARPKPPAHKLCVITYANDAGAWFPYFYKYYSSLVGETAIYVITPKPNTFSAYSLGGIITCADMSFDDTARSQLMSGIATGLQAYYEWTLVCDVDELVFPHPDSALGFFELLDAESNDVIVSRGLDVVQMDDDADFSFELPVLQQRRFANPNIALCKPHIARVPVQYSGGHHYCNYKLALPPQREGFITLHLKWACKRIRREVASIVAETSYVNEKTADYCMNSVSERSFDSRLKSYLGKTVEGLNSAAMRAFERNYAENLVFSAARGLWIGQHITAPFLIDLEKNDVDSSERVKS